MKFCIDIIKEARERIQNMSEEEFDIFFEEFIEDCNEHEQTTVIPTNNCDTCRYRYRCNSIKCNGSTDIQCVNCGASWEECDECIDMDMFTIDEDKL